MSDLAGPSGPAPRTPGRGFTLIELLLAISIGGVVLSALFQIYSGVTRSALRVEAAADEVQAWRFFAERLRRDVVNLAAEGFRGGPATLAISVTAPNGARQRVRYALADTVEGQEVRRSVGAAGGVAVYQGVRGLAFRYFDGEAWREDSGDGGLPRAVECVVDLDERRRTLVLGVEIQLPGQDADA